MRLREMKEAAYGNRLYRMPSDEAIGREARWSGSSFADMKTGYESIWGLRRSLNKQSPV